MVKEKEFFIKLIDASLYNKKILENIDLDWNDLKEEARQHNCMAIIFPTIKQIQMDFDCIPKDIYEEWEEKVVEMAAAQCIKNYELNHILDCLRQVGVEGIIFKGAVIADTYPEYLLRVSGDADVLIKAEDEKLALDILAKEGYLINYAESKENETTLYKGNILVIELHTSLWEDYKGDHIDKLNDMNITDENLFVDFQGCDIQAKTLGITKHFTYIFYHMIKHFIPGGIGIRHLLDITLFYNKYENEIDLNEFYENMHILGYDMFCKAIFRLCIDLFNMKTSVLPDEYEIDKNLYNKLIDDIIDAGVFGNKTIERIKARNIIKQTYYEGDKVQPSKIKVLLNTLFPKAEAMSDNYVNARKYKFLLPVAWTQRAIHHFVCKIKYEDEPSLSQKTKSVEDRMRLLKELDLMK